MDRRASRSDVQQTYDRIASHFSHTRHSPWPEVKAFVNDAARSSYAIDIGCGNGRHLDLLQSNADHVIGIDFSRNALREAKQQGTNAQLIQGDALHLPLGESEIDLAVYVATLHHIPERDERIASLNELARVLKDEAAALVSVWSVTDERFNFDRGQDHWVSWTLPSGESVDRYYHIFDHDEFASELDHSELRVASIEESSGNWYARVTAGKDGQIG